MRKMDQNLQLLRAMDIKLIALSIHVDRLERLIAHVGESAAQVGSQVWRQQDETEELVEHLVQEKQHLAAHEERQEPAARLGTLGLPQEGKELGGSWRLGFSTFCTSTPCWRGETSWGWQQGGHEQQRSVVGHAVSIWWPCRQRGDQTENPAVG